VILSVEQAVAESVARWLGSSARPGRACLRTNLPPLAFPRFFETFGKIVASLPDHVFRLSVEEKDLVHVYLHAYHIQ
jgi:hypothetical protein